jgi:methionyl-tRNA formyltransferase
MNIVFMGTPDFSVRILRALHEAHGVKLVVTQPDKEVGRKRVLTPPPIKVTAEELGIPVVQPRHIKTDYQAVLDAQPDLVVTAAYGQIIPMAILKAPRYGCINVHGSLLPLLRGGAPIQRAIQRMHNTTGITIMHMARRMDAGDIIAQRSITIQPDDTSGTLFEKLSILGRDLLLDTLPAILDGTAPRRPQDEDLATYAYNITREEERLDWNKTCKEIDAHIRAFTPEPTVYTTIDGMRLKILRAKPCVYGDVREFEEVENGTIVAVQDDHFGVKASDGIIKVYRVQLAGKTPQDVSLFLQGAGRNLIRVSRAFQ